MIFDRNGKLVKGPWGDRPPEPRDDAASDDGEQAEVRELFHRDISEDVMELLEAGVLPEKKAAFTIVETLMQRPIPVIIINLNDKDFAKFSLMYSKSGFAGTFNWLLPRRDASSVAVPLIKVELPALGHTFYSMVSIAKFAEIGELHLLKYAATSGKLAFVVVSEKYLFDDRYYYEEMIKDMNSIWLFNRLVIGGLDRFEEQPWSLDEEDAFLEKFRKGRR